MTNSEDPDKTAPQGLYCFVSPACPNKGVVWWCNGPG